MTKAPPLKTTKKDDDSQVLAEKLGWFKLAETGDHALFFHIKHGHALARDWDELASTHHSLKGKN